MHFFLSILLTLFTFIQPAMAQSPEPATSSLPSISTIEAPYPSDQPLKLIVLNTVFGVVGQRYINSGPPFPPEAIRIDWICPNGSYLSNNACYNNFELVYPSAAEIAVPYDLNKAPDDPSYSADNPQILYTRNVDPSNIIDLPIDKGLLTSETLRTTTSSSSTDDDANRIIKKSRRGSSFTCPTGIVVKFPLTCP